MTASVWQVIADLLDDVTHPDMTVTTDMAGPYVRVTIGVHGSDRAPVVDAIAGRLHTKTEPKWQSDGDDAASYRVDGWRTEGVSVCVTAWYWLPGSTYYVDSGASEVPAEYQPTEEATDA